jgi:hypothetical protein
MNDEARLRRLEGEDIRDLPGPTRQRVHRKLRSLREKVRNQDSPSEKKPWSNVMETLAARPRKKRK